jgi:hypothetical protein
MDLWTYPNQPESDVDVVGFDVVAVDGSIGKVDEATYDTGQSCLVVDTGFWIFGKKRVLPAGVVDRVDADSGKIFVNRTKDEVKNAPDWDEDTWRSDGDRQRLEEHYTNQRFPSQS